MKGNLKYLLDLSRGHRRGILASFFVGILGVLLSLAFIWASKIVVDIASGAAGGNLARACCIMVALLVVQLLCSLFGAWISSKLSVETGNEIRQGIFLRLMAARWNALEKFHTGDIVGRVEKDAGAVTNFLVSVVPSSAVTIIQLVAAFIFFLYLDSVLPWIILSVLPLLLLGGRLYMRRMKDFTHKVRTSDADIQSVIQESLQNRAVIKSMEEDERRAEMLGGMQDTLRRRVMSRASFSITVRGLASLAFSAGYATAFIWAAFGLSQGTITFGTMTAFLQLVSKIQRPALSLSRLVPVVANMVTSVERIREVENVPSEVKGSDLFFDEAPKIEFRDVDFAYDEASGMVFKNFSHVFPAGLSTAVMGGTGRGKTTLIRLMLALAEPSSGSVSIGGEKVSPSTRCNFVYVPQGNSLFSGSIADNLRLGDSHATIEEMKESLLTAAAEFVFDLPGGLDFVLTEKGGGLSEGQAQRIAIARALLRPGRVMLLDEATSALDLSTETRIVENLRERHSGKTVIFVTHHESLAEVCDETVRL